MFYLEVTNLDAVIIVAIGVSWTDCIVACALVCFSSMDLYI